MLWKIIGATVAFFILYVCFIALSPALNIEGSQVVLQYGSVSLNSFTVGQMVAQNIMFFGASLVIGVIFLVIYLFASAFAEENDSGIISE